MEDSEMKYLVGLAVDYIVKDDLGKKLLAIANLPPRAGPIPLEDSVHFHNSPAKRRRYYD